HCHINDPVELEVSEVERFEQAIVDTSRRNGSRGIIMLPGVAPILAELNRASASGSVGTRWAICTSATRKYAQAALAISGVVAASGGREPGVFVAAEDVAHGKPAPDPYLLGAKLCGVRPERCLVVEDAPSGVRSGLAAGCAVLAVLTSHTREQVEATRPTYVVPTLESVSVRLTDRGTVE
ncbi:hypothetical protein HK405_001231, partial [Cladochytrium tenue]